jgi:hypothetical protein
MEYMALVAEVVVDVVLMVVRFSEIMDLVQVVAEVAKADKVVLAQQVVLVVEVHLDFTFQTMVRVVY